MIRVHNLGMEPPSPAPPTSSDAAGPDLVALLSRAARGDEAAFAEVYDATAARILGLAVRVVRDRAQAEEVAQEAYLRIWQSANRFDPARGSALGWMLTIAHRTAVDRVRAAEAATRRDVAYEQQAREVPHDATAEAAATQLEAVRVRRALELLTSVQREALQLAYYGGYTHTEIATMLDLPVGTAKTRIRDAMIRLRDTMGAER